MISLCRVFLVVPQDFQNQTLSGQEAEAKQAHSSVDQNEDRQQDQVNVVCLCTLLYNGRL